MSPIMFFSQPSAAIQPIQQQRDSVPPRIRIAMEFLGNLTAKAMPRAAVADNQIEWADTPEISKAELNAQATAANLLNDYFLGRFEPDAMEKMEREKVKEGIAMVCPLCQRLGGATKECDFCRGAGRVKVAPHFGD